MTGATGARQVESTVLKRPAMLWRGLWGILCFEEWIPGCKFPQAGPLALRQLSDFIRQSQCLRHATPNAIASCKVRTSYKSKLKLKICTCSHQLSTSSPGMTEKERCSGMTKKIKCPGMTCTAGARQVESIVLKRPAAERRQRSVYAVLKRPRCSGIFCEGHCALNYEKIRKVFQ